VKGLLQSLQKAKDSSYWC